MQRILTLAVTSLVVSLDSFVAGFSMSLNKRRNAMLPIVVALVTLVMCVATTFIGYVLQGLLDDYVDTFSALILVGLAVMSLLKKEEDDAFTTTALTLPECFALGVAVGLDASVANLSLALQGYGLIAPIVFAVTHYFTVLAGQLLAGKLVITNTNFFSAVILFALAMSKFI